MAGGVGGGQAVVGRWMPPDVWACARRPPRTPRQPQAALDRPALVQAETTPAAKASPRRRAAHLVAGQPHRALPPGPAVRRGRDDPAGMHDRQRRDAELGSRAPSPPSSGQSDRAVRPGYRGPRRRQRAGLQPVDHEAVHVRQAGQRRPRRSGPRSGATTQVGAQVGRSGPPQQLRPALPAAGPGASSSSVNPARRRAGPGRGAASSVPTGRLRVDPAAVEERVPPASRSTVGVGDEVATPGTV